MEIKRKPWPVAVDLYCGSGAVTEGLKSRHFRVVAAVDSDETVCRTYRANHPRVALFNSDVRTLGPLSIKPHIPAGRSLDLLVVCAPCQPFSSQNRRKGDDDREQLIVDSSKFIETLEPKLVFFENVPGLTSSPIVRELDSALKRIGYELGAPVLVDAALLGVPQRRKRCVMLASRNRAAANLLSTDLPRVPGTTVRETFKGLRALRSGESDPNDPLHFGREHQPIALERLAHIKPDGGSRSDLPARLQLECHKGRRGYPDVYGRMKWDDVAPTLTTGCTDITRGRFAHPEEDRAISLREAALLQTFPRRYKFAGYPKQIAAQIGNAVPVAMVENLVPVFRSAIRIVDRAA